MSMTEITYRRLVAKRFGGEVDPQETTPVLIQQVALALFYRASPLFEELATTTRRQMYLLRKDGVVDFERDRQKEPTHVGG